MTAITQDKPEYMIMTNDGKFIWMHAQHKAAEAGHRVNHHQTSYCAKFRCELLIVIASPHGLTRRTAHVRPKKHTPLAAERKAMKKIKALEKAKKARAKSPSLNRLYEFYGSKPEKQGKQERKLPKWLKAEAKLMEKNRKAAAKANAAKFGKPKKAKAPEPTVGSNRAARRDLARGNPRGIASEMKYRGLHTNLSTKRVD